MTDDRLLRAALCRVNRDGSKALLSIVAHEGPQAALDRLGPDLRDAILRQAAADLDQLQTVGGRLIVPADPEWPEQLDDLSAIDGMLAAPPALWVRGQRSVADVCARSVAVVGSRAYTPHGRVVTAEITGGLAQAGWTVISGAAFGIDAFAHQAALRAGGPTVAVLACGVDVAYPESHRGLLEAIVADGGLLISEVPCGLGVARWRFLARNRLIAALARGTVLVEAGLRSGALNTVGHAHALSRQVCVVPGPVGPLATAGCQREARRGRSSVVFGSADVLEDIGPVGEHLAAPTLWPLGPRDRLSPSQAALLELVPSRGGVSLEELAVRSDVAFRQLARDVTALEVAGMVRRQEGLVRLTSLAKARSGAPAPGA